MISACACGGGSSRAVALSEWVKPTCGRDTVRRATCRRAGNTPGSCSVFWTLLMVVLKPRRDRLTPILCSRSFFGRLRSSLRCSLSYSALPAVSIAVKSSRCWAPFPQAKALGGDAPELVCRCENAPEAREAPPDSVAISRGTPDGLATSTCCAGLPPFGLGAFAEPVCTTGGHESYIHSSCSQNIDFQHF